MRGEVVLQFHPPGDAAQGRQLVGDIRELKDLEATRPPAPDDPKNPAAGTGMPAFQAWMEMVIEENSPRTFDHDDFPGTVYVERDTMHDLYCMFQVNKCWGTFGKRNFQDFLCWLQNDAEVKGLLPLDDDELDAFRSTPVRQIVGDQDVLGLADARRVQAAFERHGVDAELTVLEAQEVFAVAPDVGSGRGR